MESSLDSGRAQWSEADSLRFIQQGQIYTPARDEIQATVLDLIPAERDETFLAVELGIGGGWLSEAVLERFSGSQVVGLDGSPTMLETSGQRLEQYRGRLDLRPFALEDRGWRTSFGPQVRCFVSSLVIHHLSAADKQVLYGDLLAQLEDGGAVLIADLIAPASEPERRYLAAAWDAEVRRQSLAFTGALEVYQEFVESEWNWFTYPDPFDMPSTIPEHLDWLSQAGFVGVNVFWERAGHAVYGGYKKA
jgi:tRNA (cmo5U34)-methyltransferase